MTLVARDRLLLLAFVASCVTAAFSSRADALTTMRPQAEETSVYRDVVASREVVAWATGDLSGDGRREAVVAFKDPGLQPGTRGGILVFGYRHGRLRKVYGGMWDGAFPREIGTSGRRLEVLVVEITEAGELPLEQTLVYGRDILFDDRPGGIFDGVRVDASSTLRHHRAQTDPAAVIDGDLTTGWADASRGTGVGEWIRLMLDGSSSISWIGIASGDHRSEEHRMRSNRVHRAEVTVRTLAEEGDPAAGISFQELGLDFPGERIPIRLADRPGLQYFPVHREDVRALEIRISSVYVGDRLDDTWITEVDLLGRLSPPPFPSFVIAPLENEDPLALE